MIKSNTARALRKAIKRIEYHGQVNLVSISDKLAIIKAMKIFFSYVILPVGNVHEKFAFIIFDAIL